MFRYQIFLILILLGGAYLYISLVPPVQNAQSNSSVWVSTTNLPKEIANFATITKDNRIYVIGGGLTQPDDVESPPPIKDVYYAQALSNGYLSAWMSTRFLPIPLAGHAAVITNSTIYVIGGDSGQKNDGITVLSRNTFYSSVQQNGQLSSWKKSTSLLPFGISAHSAFAKDGYLYVIGGYNTDQIASSNLILRAPIRQNGAIGDWKQNSAWNLPQSVHRHTSEIYENDVLVIGGLKRNDSVLEPLRTVYSRQIPQINDNSDWINTATLPQPLYFHSSIFSEAEQKIYTLGGFDGNFETDKVYNASIQPNGNLSSWTEVNSLKLPAKVFRHSAIMAANGSIYVLGGKQGDSHTSDVYFTPPLAFTKSSDPTGPMHEADTITYTLAYANNSFTTQTLIITDVVPFNIELIPDSISPPGQLNDSTVIWNLGDIAPGVSGQVSFQAKVPLFLSSKKTPETMSTLATDSNTSYTLPVPVTCDTTHFWANGITQQPPLSKPHTVNVQIPPHTKPSQMWLLMKYTDNITPTVEEQPANLLVTSSGPISASIWSAAIPPSALQKGRITIITQNPRELNAIFLFKENDPPFVETELDGFQNTTKTFTYTFDVPSVTTETVDVIIPFMDITYWKDNMQPDNRLTTVTVKYNGRTSQSVTANNPNLGNGLLMTQFSIDIGPISGTITSTATLEVTVDTEDSVYTVGPRICRPLYIANTAWLCSKQAGCISDTVINEPPNLKYPAELFFPFITKDAS